MTDTKTAPSTEPLLAVFEDRGASEDAEAEDEVACTAVSSKHHCNVLVYTPVLNRFSLLMTSACQNGTPGASAKKQKVMNTLHTVADQASTVGSYIQPGDVESSSSHKMGTCLQLYKAGPFDPKAPKRPRRAVKYPTDFRASAPVMTAEEKGFVEKIGNGESTGRNEKRPIGAIPRKKKRRTVDEMYAAELAGASGASTMPENTEAQPNPLLQGASRLRNKTAPKVVVNIY